MPDLTPEEKNAISNVSIKGFTQNLLSSFSTFPQYPNISITYKGDILPDGEWKYNLSTKELKTSPSGTTSPESITLVYFMFPSEVERVTLEGYERDLSSQFTFNQGYSSVNGNIVYEGIFGIYGGLWSYHTGNKELTIDRPTEGPSSYTTRTSPGNFDSNNAPFKDVFFKTTVTRAVYRTYSQSSDYLFFGLLSLKRLEAPDYTDYSSSGILIGSIGTGLPKGLPLDTLIYAKISSVTEVTAGRVKDTLVVFSAEKANSISLSAFYEFESLTTVNLPLLEDVKDHAFRDCHSLKEVHLGAATKVGAYAFSGCTSLTEINLPLVTEISMYAFDGCIASCSY